MLDDDIELQDKVNADELDGVNEDNAMEEELMLANDEDRDELDDDIDNEDELGELLRIDDEP